MNSKYNAHKQTCQRIKEYKLLVPKMKKKKLEIYKALDTSTKFPFDNTQTFYL